MEFTNPHFAPAPPAQDLCTDTAANDQCPVTDDTPALPRLREVTNSPFREYASRAGEADPLPDNVAALILSFKGRAQVQRNGIKVERKELSNEPIFFWHEDSLTCLGKQGETVLYVLNPHTPDCVHIMDQHGRYLETVPRKGSPAILDAEAAAKEIAKHRRYMTNQQTRLQQLHGEETENILKRHRENTEELNRVTNLHPAPDDGREGCPQPAAQEHTADRIANRGDHIQQGITRRRDQQASAASLGRAARDEISNQQSAISNQWPAFCYVSDNPPL